MGFYKNLLLIGILLGLFSCKNTLPIDKERKEPTGKRFLSWSGYTWEVRSSKEKEGPGPNYFSQKEENVWIDEEGNLHLRATLHLGWIDCAEVYLLTPLGYGKYHFILKTPLENLDTQLVLGLFLYESPSSDPYNREIDIEVSKWGIYSYQTAQFVLQPFNKTGHLYRFPYSDFGKRVEFTFDYQSSYIYFQALREDNSLINSYNYTGTDIPTPGNATVHINLWLYEGKPFRLDGIREVILERFYKE